MKKKRRQHVILQVLSDIVASRDKSTVPNIMNNWIKWKVKI